MLNHNFTDTSHPETYIPASGARQAEQEQSDAIDKNTADIAVLMNTDDPVLITGEQLDFFDSETGLLKTLEVHAEGMTKMHTIVNARRNFFGTILFKQDTDGGHGYVLNKDSFGDGSPQEAIGNYKVNVDPAGNSYTHIVVVFNAGLLTKVYSGYDAETSGTPMLIEVTGDKKIVKGATLILEASSIYATKIEWADNQGQVKGYGKKFIYKTSATANTDQTQVFNVTPIGADGVRGESSSIAVVADEPYAVKILTEPIDLEINATTSFTADATGSIDALPNTSIKWKWYSNTVNTGNGTLIAGKNTGVLTLTPVNSTWYRFSADNGEANDDGDTEIFSDWFKVTVAKTNWGSTKPVLGVATVQGSNVTQPLTLPAGTLATDCEYKQPGDEEYTEITAGTNSFVFAAHGNVPVGSLLVRIKETAAKDASDDGTNAAMITVTVTTEVLFTEVTDNTVTGVGTNSVVSTAAVKAAKTAVKLPVGGYVLASNNLSAPGPTGFLCLQSTGDLPLNIESVEYGLYMYTGDGHTNLLSLCRLGDTSAITTQIVAFNKLYGWRRTATQIIAVYSNDNGVTVTDASGPISFPVESAAELTIMGYFYSPNTKLTNVKITQ